VSAALIQGTKAANFLPIWSCSVWGLPCPRHYCRGGALLPHLFTLTPFPGRYVFCGTFRPSGLNLTSRTLSGTLLCGVRTFLSSHPKMREAAVRSGCLQHSLYATGSRPRTSGPGPQPSGPRIFRHEASAVRGGKIRCRLISSQERGRCLTCQVQGRRS